MRRWTPRILVSLLFGIVTTIAVAWIAARWPATLTPLTMVRQPPGAFDNFTYLEAVRFKDEVRIFGGYEFESWGGNCFEYWGWLWVYLGPLDVKSLDSQAAHDAIEELAREDQRWLPAWAAARREFGLKRGFQLTADGRFCDRGFGWPARGLSYSMVVTSRGNTRSPIVESEGLWPMPSWSSSDDQWYAADQPHGLPLRPIWSGLVLNTLFFAALWFILFFGPGQARRMIRRKRGRCPQCGYNLRGALEPGCPECGWNRAESGM